MATYSKTLGIISERERERERVDPTKCIKSKFLIDYRIHVEEFSKSQCSYHIILQKLQNDCLVSIESLNQNYWQSVLLEYSGNKNMK